MLKIDFLIYGLLILLSFILFWNNHLDLWAAGKFYHLGEQDLWFEQNDLLWKFFYHAAPWLTGVLLLGSLLILLNQKFIQYRIYAIFIFLVIALGPGLVVNSIFKPYWGRPRPREIIEFQGQYNYRPFYVAEFGAQGKSFPCGHCSVGFSYGVFYFIYRKRNKKIAYSALITSIAFGFLMGVGRIAAGGHFLSDVIWAGLMTWGVALWLYYFVLKIPQREDGEILSDEAMTRVGQFIVQRKKLTYTIYAILSGLTVTALLLASPFHKDIELSVGQGREISNLSIDIAQGNVEFHLDDLLQSAFVIQGYAKGFGFPKNKVLAECIGEDNVKCEIHKKGFFSDYESVLKLRVNSRLVKALQLRVLKGDVDQKEANLPSTYLIKTE